MSRKVLRENSILTGEKRLQGVPTGMHFIIHFRHSILEGPTAKPCFPSGGQFVVQLRSIRFTLRTGFDPTLTHGSFQDRVPF